MERRFFPMQTFYVKTKVCSSDGAMDILGNFAGRNAVIFTDAFMVKSGVAARVAGKLSNCADVRIFDEIKPDPPIELVASGLQFLLDANADLVVALGGGSSIDCAKVVALSKIPSKDTLYAMLAGGLNATIAGLARAINAVKEKQEAEA